MFSLRQFIRRKWWIFVPLTGSISVFILLFFRVFIQGNRYLSSDGALYLYNGWGLVNGQIPYLHTWDVKGPAIHLTTGFLALISGGDRGLQYILAFILTGTCLIAICVFSSLIVKEIVGDTVAAAVSGVVPLTYTPFILLYANGPYTKYYVTAFGFIGIYLYLRERYMLSAGSAAVAVAYWQFGIIFLIVILVGIAEQVRRGNVKLKVFGGSIGLVLGLALIFITPFLLLGAVKPLIIQTVLVPIFNDSSNGSILFQFYGILFRFGPAIPVLIAGCIGIVLGQRKSHNTDEDIIHLMIFSLLSWFILIGSITGQVGRPDLIPLSGVIAIGTGMLMSYTQLCPKTWCPDSIPRTTKISTCILLGVLFLGLISPIFFGIENHLFFGGEVADVYRTGGSTDICHFRQSNPEMDWVRLTNGDPERTTCRQEVGNILQNHF